jgi:hypothetical protein
MANTYPAALSRNTRNSLIYADAISAVWAWWDLIADPSYALREDLDIWEVAQRDPQVYQGIQQRLNAVAGREWRVMPAGDSKRPGARIKAAIMDAMIRRIPHFQDARRRLAQAVFRGQSCELICGRREFVSLADQPSMMWFVPTGMKHIDPRRFVIRPEREQTPNGVRVRGKLYMSVIPTYQSLPSVQPSPAQGRKGIDRALWQGRYVPVKHPEWFVRIVYDDEEARLGFGRGVMDAVYFTMWAKQIVIREGLQGLERFVHGVPVITIDPSKRGDTTQTSESIRDTALAKLKIMRAGHAYALNVGETLDFKEPGGVGNQMVMGFLEYLDRRLMAVLTGASLRSGGNPGESGSYASDAVGMEMSDAVVQYDRDRIDEDLTLDLIGLLNRLNRPQFAALGKLLGISGLEDELPGQFTTVVKRTMDPLVAMQIVQGAQQVKGLDLLRAEVYEKLGGFSMPSSDDEDVIEGGAAMQSGPMATLPDGMPAPGAVVETGEDQDEDQYPEGAPEDREELFGHGTPEDDESLFTEDAPVAPEGSLATIVDEEEGENPTPEDELVDLPAAGPNDATDSDVDTDRPEGADETPEPTDTTAEPRAVEGQPGVVETPGPTPVVPQVKVKVDAGTGPSDNVEIEGMEQQREKAKGER